MEFDRMAMQNAREDNCAVVYAVLALVQEVERMAESLEKAVKMLEEAEDGPDTHLPPSITGPTIAEEVKDAWCRPGED